MCLGRILPYLNVWQHWSDYLENLFFGELIVVRYQQKVSA